MKPNRKPLTRARRALTAAALGAALLTACGGGDGGDGGQVAAVDGGASPDAAAGDADPAEQGRKFAECLRENGLEVPDPDPATGELDLTDAAGEGEGRDALMTAFEACRDLAPEQYAEQPEPGAEQLDAMREFAACMRENGIDVPDPDPAAGLEPGAVDPAAPGYDAALEACQEHLDGMGRG
ncbi:hypothetical protein [Streptomyces sp. MP131-18]|uniref:hypothetical protein n=1 Tax=Streptomyces sp. MP131-18 TaxID=1857892 RepID=UPI0009C5F639|nr:hypothetical protein [Streptomyces sp. MP131-18]ONK13461.1 hypothetical protein STBA_42280 [Streptomyces sp. MP131-18]